jgi:hypothetical protein
MDKTAKFTVSMTAAEFRELESERMARGLSRSQFIRDTLQAAKAAFRRSGEVKEDAGPYETTDLKDLASAAEDRRKRAIAAAGRFRSGVTDLSTRHDEYLEEAYTAVSPEKDDRRNRRRP